MQIYFLRRLLLVFPTLFGVLLINFSLVQFAPGGPIERLLARMHNADIDASARLSGATAGEVQNSSASGDGSVPSYRGARGLDVRFIASLERQFGLDKPPLQRFVIMLKSYLSFDFGSSFYRDESVLNLIKEKLPVSISLGLWTTLLVYFISIPLGIRKAVRAGTPFDSWSSFMLVIGSAIPAFLFAILLIVLFAGGSFWSIFPLRGLTSDHFSELSLLGKVADYFWHLVLPLLAMSIGGFASLTLLTKNAFLENLTAQYVTSARAKGVSDRRVLYGHVFRNAMLIVIAGFPAAFIGIFFTSAAFIEIIFSLDGLGLLTYQAVIDRDYPIFFATLYIFSLVGLLLGILSDLTYHFVDPRIDFEARS